jgi:hypothetical protein
MRLSCAVAILATTVNACGARRIDATAGGAQSAAPAGPAVSAAAGCEFAGERFAWADDALAGWHRVNHAHLRIAPVVPPVMVLFDESCTYTLRPAADRSSAPITLSGRAFQSSAVRHAGKIALPDGAEIPAQLTSFAAPMKEGGMSFVMALPSIWRTSAKASDPRVLATAVFMHEFTHTQSGWMGRRIDSLTQRGLDPDADDDVVQTRFADRPGFAAAYARERDLLYAAYAATELGEARRLAAEALQQMTRRRAQFYTGEDAVYADAEDVFLTMEGSGQYAAYAWLTDPQGAARTADDALGSVRRDGRRWSQDEGLALFLVLQRLGVDWAAEVFGPSERTVIATLSQAVR